MRGDGLAPACKQKRRAAVTASSAEIIRRSLSDGVNAVLRAPPGNTVDQKSEIKSMV
jgi:hypothetical protein